MNVLLIMSNISPTRGLLDNHAFASKVFANGTRTAVCDDGPFTKRYDNSIITAINRKLNFY